MIKKLSLICRTTPVCIQNRLTSPKIWKMIIFWLLSTLLGIRAQATPVCEQDQYSTIHFCDGIGPDIPKEKFRKWKIIRPKFSCSLKLSQDDIHGFLNVSRKARNASFTAQIAWAFRRVKTVLVKKTIAVSLFIAKKSLFWNFSWGTEVLFLRR